VSHASVVGPFGGFAQSRFNAAICLLGSKRGRRAGVVATYGSKLVDLVRLVDQFCLMRFMNVGEAKSNFSKLLELAHAGEEVIIAKGGKPYARLVALAPPQARVPGLLGTTQIEDSFFEPLPPGEPVVRE
jgi:antitoxin (DNA-binding transcriptional repressor) of toxin-antitoxin stability system